MKLLSALLVGALVAVIPASAQIFTAGPGLALAIPDNLYNGTVGTMGCSTIAVPSGGGGGDTVANVIVTIAQSHTWVGDLTIKLIGPTGIVTTLVSRPGVVETADDGNDTAGVGDSSNLLVANPLTYDQVAVPESETMGSVPNLSTSQTICVDLASPCTYNPNRGAAVATSEDLSTAYDGTTKVGNWQLCLGDSAVQDTGTLDGWTLNITSVPVELQSFTVGD
ncbi:MAG TPA: proprotein convertase P-domain-containing protein [Thermoanaerobaculia bacterium]|jgi:subtilisin-like proprotein convertase family protein|nr:proprotein convertase P-domain-containing protein [Thermoanaerobaculia bacterium]